MKAKICILLCLWIFSSHLPLCGRVVTDSLILSRIFNVAECGETLDENSVDSLEEYSYSRYFFQIKKRNLTLLVVPSLFAIANSGKRMYISESFDKMLRTKEGYRQIESVIEYSNMQLSSKIMPLILNYLQPQIYRVTMIQDFLLSPFNRQNKKFYQYKMMNWTDSVVTVLFTPKVDNTMLVKGRAIVDCTTGKVLKVRFTGEHDMVRFTLHLVQNKSKDVFSSQECQLQAIFKFLGNKLEMEYTRIYGIESLDSSITSQKKTIQLFESIRRDTLTEIQNRLYQELYARKLESSTEDTIVKVRKENILWNIIEDNLVNKIKTHFGTENQGYIRINPLLNPLYMGYNARRGFTYKFDLRGIYLFSTMSELSWHLKAGYGFKEKQFYFRLPIQYYYNKSNNFFSILEIGNGNRINSSTIADVITTHIVDSMKNSNFDLYKFKEDYVHFLTNYNLSDKFSFQMGWIFKQRIAIDSEAFTKVNMERKYRTFAPKVEVEYRPHGWTGPIISLDYERGIKNIFRSNTEYERWELDMQYIKRLTRLQALSLRIGTGLYTLKGDDAHFLDFENFRENTLPSGWNDDWSGEFELLNSNWYNTSRYYFRTNLTYESPMLFVSRLPLIGRYIEMERIYLSGLSVKKLHPYIEYGYSFTTRLCSLGLFFANRNGKFDGVSCKFGLELFRRW